MFMTVMRALVLSFWGYSGLAIAIIGTVAGSRYGRRKGE